MIRMINPKYLLQLMKMEAFMNQVRVELSFRVMWRCSLLVKSNPAIMVWTRRMIFYKMKMISMSFLIQLESILM